MATRRTASIALSAIALAVMASGCGIRFSIKDYSKKMAADAQVTAQVTAVNIESGSGTIHVHSATGPGVSIQRTVHYNSGHPHPTQSVQNGTLTFDNGCRHCSVDYDVTVPASLPVTAHADSGDVTVEGVQSADLKTSSGTLTANNIKGSVSAHVDSGDIKLETVGGAVDISTDSGSINASGLGGTVSTAHTDSGDIRLDFITAPTSLTAHASSGDIHVEVPSQPYWITGTSSSGDRKISVDTSQSSASHLDLNTDSGDVTVDPA